MIHPRDAAVNDTDTHKTTSGGYSVPRAKESEPSKSRGADDTTTSSPAVPSSAVRRSGSPQRDKNSTDSNTGLSSKTNTDDHESSTRSAIYRENNSMTGATATESGVRSDNERGSLSNQPQHTPKDSSAPIFGKEEADSKSRHSKASKRSRNSSSDTEGDSRNSKNAREKDARSISDGRRNDSRSGRSRSSRKKGSSGTSDSEGPERKSQDGIASAKDASRSQENRPTTEAVKGKTDDGDGAKNTRPHARIDVPNDKQVKPIKWLGSDDEPFSMVDNKVWIESTEEPRGESFSGTTGASDENEAGKSRPQGTLKGEKTAAKEKDGPLRDKRISPDESGQAVDRHVALDVDSDSRKGGSKIPTRKGRGKEASTAKKGSSSDQGDREGRRKVSPPVGNGGIKGLESRHAPTHGIVSSPAGTRNAGSSVLSPQRTRSPAKDGTRGRTDSPTGERSRETPSKSGSGQRIGSRSPGGMEGKKSLVPSNDGREEKPGH